MVTTLLVIAIILSSLAFIASLFAVYAVWRLNKYISVLIEDKLEEQENKIDVLHQSLSIAVGEKMLNSNGRIKKPLI
jgi:hypothetical protein